MSEITGFISALHLAAKALQFYTAEHPRGIEALSTLDQSINAVLAKRPRLSLSVANGTLLLDGQPLVAEAPHEKASVRAVAKELEARHLGGLIITKGVNYRELMELVRLVLMKPQQIQNAGGPEEIFRRADVIHVRASNVRYEAVSEGEEIVRSGSVVRIDESDAGAPLALLLRRFLLREKGEGGGATAPEEVSSLSDALATPTSARELLQQALAGATPETQLAILLSVKKLPDGTMRDALYGPMQDALGGGGAGGVGSGEGGLLAQLLAGGSTDSQVELLRARVAELGISREQLDEVLSVVGWEKLSANEKIEKLLTGNRIYDFPSEKLIVFIRELLEAGKKEDTYRLLECYGLGLSHDALSIRRSIADTLGQMTAFIVDPGVGPQIEQLFLRVILNHFMRETDPRMHTTLAEAAASLIAALAASGRSDVALQTLNRLDAAIGVAPPDAPVRRTYESMDRALNDPRRASQIVGQILTTDGEQFTRAIIPLVVHFGTALSPHLIEALANEEERNRRGRLIKALKSIGKPAHPFLLEALQSPTWYVVRNTLNVLGDIGEREHVAAIGQRLQHSDPRVRRAAARTLGKIRGEAGEALLTSAIRDRDLETQNEVLLCLGSMKAQGSVSAICDLAKSRGEEKVRETALATLGQIGSDTAVPALGEILRPKGLFARESLTIRTAAAKALATIGTPEAREILRNAVATETDRAAKDAFAKFVV
jgi:HEAT repeat protein